MSFLGKIIDKRLSAYQTTLIETHFAEVDTMYQQIRGWRHDYRNHIQLLKSYAQAGNLLAIQHYLDELDGDLSKIDSVVKTGNQMMDSILNSKISLARAKAIEVSVEAQISMLLTTPDLDLCIIIGNLFDNAIEASLALPEAERLIRVYMEIKGQQLYISFTNFTARKKQKKIGGRFQTSKGNGHGFGLLRIDTIIERHGGYISRNSEDGAFTTEILLPQ